MIKNNEYDLVGIGAGPFNLSLLSLIQKTKLRSILLEKSSGINWHSEISFKDSIMQTSYLKDLVTSIDPTNPHSFLNYLVTNGLFYQFMNTSRSVVTRKEYEDYLKWVGNALHEQISFGSEVTNVQISNKEKFLIETKKSHYFSSAICLATGVTPRIPEFAKPFISKNCFHAKSNEILNLDLTEKNVVIIGGGQTGLEIFRNALNHKWGKFNELKLLSTRSNLLPLDESPFTNEYFTPNYVQCFYKLDESNKQRFLAEQKLASDGNTPTYLLDLYRDLYHTKLIEKDQRKIEIMPNRKAHSLSKSDTGLYYLNCHNSFTKKDFILKADIVIFASGFETNIPKFLEPLQEELVFDEENKLHINMDYSLNLKSINQDTSKLRIYVQNLSKHHHGISDPQTSLMPWRSASIINSLNETHLKTSLYPNKNDNNNFINFCQDE